ncbi:MAG: GNAT family N-acetyltransferase [Desulfovibrionaceae bacterium]|nr:GNAT family N-acetyltransferase [Desulfovibrionaceae bacterium]
MDLTFRLGEAADAPFLANCVTEVSQGVVEALLDNLLPLVSATKILTMVLQDDSQAFSYKNCLLAHMGQDPKGLLFAYDACEQKIPKILTTIASKTRLKPLEDLLTCQIPKTLYINTLWVSDDFRGEGLADALIDYAKDWAKSLQLTGLSLFAARNNTRAVKFYQRMGFVARREVFIPETLQSKISAGDLYFCEL